MRSERLVVTVTCDTCGYVFDDVEDANLLHCENMTIDMCNFCVDVLLRMAKDAKKRYEDGFRALVDQEV